MSDDDFNVMKSRAYSISSSRPTEDFARKLGVDSKDVAKFWQETAAEAEVDKADPEHFDKMVNRHRKLVEKISKRPHYKVKEKADSAMRPPLPADKKKAERHMHVQEHGRTLQVQKVDDARQRPDVPAPAAELLSADDVYKVPPTLSETETSTTASTDSGKKKKPPRPPAQAVPDWQRMRDHFQKEGRLQPDAARRVLSDAVARLSVEANLLALEAPLIVCGDTHGQYFDLLNLFAKAGWPNAAGDRRFLFLGDYVDRGCFGCEVVLLLCALKVNYPRSIYLLRGNHESRIITTNYNFKQEVLTKYDEDTFDSFVDFFEALPLAATVTNQQGRFLCVHGGLSPSIVMCEDINAIDRFNEIPKAGPLCDLVWSDPLGDWTAEELNELEMEEWYDVAYEDNPDRGCSYVFGWKAVEAFLYDNKLLSIIRAHEVQKEGYLLHTFHRDEREIPPLITVFSAPNYCDMYQNQAAYLQITDSSYEFVQISWDDHPYWLPSFKDAITFTFPYVVESLAQAFADILSLEDGDVLEEGSPEHEELMRKMKAAKSLSELKRKMEAMRQLNEQQLKENASTAMKRFEEAYTLDHDREYVHPAVRFRSKSDSSVSRRTSRRMV